MVQILLILSALILITSPTFATEKLAALETDITKELLLYYDWDEMLVESANRRPTKILDAPSPIYVFTAEDIERTGVRNLMELVKYIPGFYIYPRIDQPFTIANRGIRSSSNDKILILLDGIPLNNITKSGAVNADKFPGLDKVKRVEVIPGPGSTMWGSDAQQAIISIVTKDAKDIDGTFIKADGASEDNHTQIDFISGKEIFEGEYVFSFTYAQNDGFGDERNGFQNYVHDFDSIPWNDQRAKFNHLYPSYEMFGKITISDFTLKAVASEKSIYSFWGSSTNTDWYDVQDKKSIMTSRDMHLEFSHHSELSGKMTLDTKLSAYQIEYIRDRLVEVGTNHGSLFDDPANEPIHGTAKFPENGIGLEMLYNWDINETNKLLAGARVRVVNAGPAESNYVNLNTGQTADNANARDSVYHTSTRDTTYGLFVEDTYSATDDLTLIGGLRIDYNEPRERKSVLSPRAAAIYKFTDALSAKYMYNTGYVRPSVDKSFEISLHKEGKVKESEKIRSHDVALTYHTDKTQFIIDFFHMTIYDRNMYNANLLAHVDYGDIFTQGVELSVKRSFFDGKLIFDLNYGFAEAEEEDDDGNKFPLHEGIPQHVYAVGLNYLFTDKISLYVNVNGWRDLEMENARATVWYAQYTHPDHYDGDYLVDLNLRCVDLFKDSLDLNLYVLNVTDREARLQAKDDWQAWWTYARGRSIGLKLSWLF